MIKKIKNALETVETLLAVKPELRDNDSRLISNFWALEIGLNEVANMKAAEFLHYFSKGNLTPAESITRARRKVQEENPSLRGATYRKRQQNAKDVQKGIND